MRLNTTRSSFWVSITQPGLSKIPTEARRFPAVLDTGFNDAFLIQWQHFVGWAGLRAQDFAVLDHLFAYGTSIPMLDADIWIHRNRVGKRDEFSPRSPFRLQLDSGIAVCPGEITSPRLPLLGVLGLARSHLHLHLDCGKHFLSMRTPPSKRTAVAR